MNLFLGRRCHQYQHLKEIYLQKNEVCDQDENTKTCKLQFNTDV